MDGFFGDLEKAFDRVPSWLAAVSTELVARISVERKASAYPQLTVSH